VPCARNYLQCVESELGEGVRPRALLPGHHVAILSAQLRIKERDGTIDTESMTLNIRDVVRESAQGEGVVIDISGFLEQCLNEIAAPDVVRKVAKEAASERVITHVLDDTTPVRIGLSLSQLVGGSVRKAFKQKRLDLVIPFGVDDRLVRQHRVCEGWAYRVGC
jgi:hypothetical protein